MDEQLDLLAGLSRSSEPASGDEHLVSRERWGTYERHDPVRVSGLRGEHVFWAHVTNPTTGDEWITVYGGLKHGVRQFRSVEVTDVRPQRAKAIRRPRPSADPDAQPSLDL